MIDAGPSWLDDVEVRFLQPYQATKAYRCPSCHRDIPDGTGHYVVVPREAPDLRRHWHRGCWTTEAGRIARSADAAARPRTRGHRS